MKRCSKCGMSKPLRDFRPRQSSRDGRHGWCDPCYRTYYSAAMRRWRANNPERSRTNERQWIAKNPERNRAKYARYNKRHRAYCATTENITIDHVVPLSRGGKHEPANLAPACRSCNSRKGAKLLDEWLPLRAT